MKPAVASRVFQFEAGPERHRFFACSEHAPELQRPPMCFLMFLRAEDRMDEEHDPADELTCDYCREG